MHSNWPTRWQHRIGCGVWYLRLPCLRRVTGERDASHNGCCDIAGAAAVPSTSQFSLFRSQLSHGRKTISVSRVCSRTGASATLLLWNLIKTTRNLTYAEPTNPNWKWVRRACWASSISSQHDAAHICCWAPAPAARRSQLSINICSIHRRSAANTPVAVAVVNRWDKRTDGRTPNRYVDPTLITMRVASKTKLSTTYLTCHLSEAGFITAGA